MTREARQSIQDRRGEVLTAAIEEFAVRGLHGASTETIARRVGISQPYIFKIFGTKKDLFIASVNHVCDRIMATFEATARDMPRSADTLDALGDSYLTLGRLEFLVFLQGIVACDDADVKAVIKRRWSELNELLMAVSDGAEEPIEHFLAHGMLRTIQYAADLSDVMPPWAAP